jgi:hypothetical protein
MSPKRSSTHAHDCSCTAVKIFAAAKISLRVERCGERRGREFPNSLNEMGRENENAACTSAARSQLNCAARKIVFVERRLVRFARVLCCAHLDAAMHNRNSWNQRKLDSISKSKGRSIRLMQLISVLPSF